MNEWYVYIVSCADASLYTGITTDVARRIDEHNNNSNRDNKGARYTRGRRPVRLVYQETCTNRITASQREYQIKQLSRQQKLTLIATHE